MKRPLQFPRIRTVFRSRATQMICADALGNITTACIIAAGYLLLFAKDNSHAHRLLWVAILAADAVMAFVGSVDLQGDSK